MSLNGGLQGHTDQSSHSRDDSTGHVVCFPYSPQSMCWATERPLSECSVMDKVTWARKETRLNLVVGTKVTTWHHVTALLRPGSGCTTSGLASFKEWLAGLPSLKDLQRVQGLSLNESDSKLGAQNL